MLVGGDFALRNGKVVDVGDARARALLALEDGTSSAGWSCGADGEAAGELCFNTSMSGYQEVLTDPSYAGQIVTMTMPHIGNYGVNGADMESRGVFADGLRRARDVPRCRRTGAPRSRCPTFLRASRRRRDRGRRHAAASRGTCASAGAMRAVDLDDRPRRRRRSSPKAQASPGLVGRDLVRRGRRRPSRTAGGREGPPGATAGRHRRAAGRRRATASSRSTRASSTTSCAASPRPAATSPSCRRRRRAEEVLALEPDGVFLANGPGDPAAVDYLYGTLRELLGVMPVFGICLGHQMLSLAVGAQTYKLKYGHRGGNQPVKNLLTGPVEITSQNHGFCVDFGSIGPLDAEASGGLDARRRRPRRVGARGRGAGRALASASAACSSRT